MPIAAGLHLIYKETIHYNTENGLESQGQASIMDLVWRGCGFSIYRSGLSTVVQAELLQVVVGPSEQMEPHRGLSPVLWYRKSQEGSSCVSVYFPSHSC